MGMARFTGFIPNCPRKINIIMFCGSIVPAYLYVIQKYYDSRYSGRCQTAILIDHISIVMRIVLAVVVLVIISVQQVYAFTTFHVPIRQYPNGTVIEGIQFDDDGEQANFIWTRINETYRFRVTETCCFHYDNVISVAPGKLAILNISGMFAVNATIPPGDYAEICITEPARPADCFNGQVDQDGRLTMNYTAGGNSSSSSSVGSP